MCPVGLDLGVLGDPPDQGGLSLDGEGRWMEWEREPGRSSQRVRVLTLQAVVELEVDQHPWRTSQNTDLWADLHASAFSNSEPGAWSFACLPPPQVVLLLPLVSREPQLQLRSHPRNTCVCL